MAILQHTVESQYKRSLVVSAAHTMLLPYLAKSGQSNRLALTLLFRWSTLGLTLNCLICCVITSEMDCLHGFFCWFESVVCLKHMQWCLICCVIASETDCLHENSVGFNPSCVSNTTTWVYNTSHPRAKRIAINPREHCPFYHRANLSGYMPWAEPCAQTCIAKKTRPHKAKD